MDIMKEEDLETLLEVYSHRFWIETNDGINMIVEIPVFHNTLPRYVRTMTANNCNICGEFLEVNDSSGYHTCQKCGKSEYTKGRFICTNRHYICKECWKTGKAEIETKIWDLIILNFDTYRDTCREAIEGYQSERDAHTFYDEINCESEYITFILRQLAENGYIESYRYIGSVTQTDLNAFYKMACSRCNDRCNIIKEIFG